MKGAAGEFLALLHDFYLYFYSLQFQFSGEKKKEKKKKKLTLFWKQNVTNNTHKAGL